VIFLIAVSSSALLKEFTLYADKANDNNEICVIQRSNEKHVVMLSLDEYNRMNKQLFLLENKNLAQK
jgi:antitoxin YefM